MILFKNSLTQSFSLRPPTVNIYTCGLHALNQTVIKCYFIPVIQVIPVKQENESSAAVVFLLASHALICSIPFVIWFLPMFAN